MAICTKCGAQVADTETVCPTCGEAMKAEPAADTKADIGAKLNELNDTPNTTAEFDPADIEKNKLMGVLAYLSWLVLIPLLAAPNSKFARFHANQGLVLAIAEIIYGVAYSILSFILAFIPIIGWILIGVLGLLSIVFLVLAILGIVNVVNGQAKELPIVGKYKILK